MALPVIPSKIRMHNSTPPLDSPAYYSDIESSDESTSSSPRLPNGIITISTSNRGHKLKRSHTLVHTLPSKRFKSFNPSNPNGVGEGIETFESFSKLMKKDGKVGKSLGQKKGGRKLEMLALSLVGLVENEKPLMKELGRTVEVLEGGKHLGVVWKPKAEEGEGDGREDEDGIGIEGTERLISPEALIKDMFVSSTSVTIPMEASNINSRGEQVWNQEDKEMNENEQLELAKDCIKELTAFWGECYELQERLGEMRTGVLEVERRRRAVGNIGRLLVDHEAGKIK